MERTDELIELGTASVETKGPVGHPKDESLGIPGLGLADD
jgi:hypothetical protein